jgi:glutathione S-transferase
MRLHKRGGLVLQRVGAMAAGRLVIGNRRYSSWSMRGWLAVRLAGLDVADEVLPMGETSTPAIKDGTPAGLVPYLEHDGARVWDTLAICEYCAEAAPGLWPQDRVARAEARSIAAEMHAGFRGLRMAMPMNLGRSFPGAGRNAESLADIARVEAVWAGARARHGAGGPFLFGASFGLADAMYAPVVARFLSYAPEISAASAAYCQAVRGHALVAQWYGLAAQEPDAWLLNKYEAG